jgi:crotonobetainyl-CoA:carnitine CoA-transferase CaiB-like acyl-CoA transferase
MPPLDGLKVVDLTRVLAGPFCAMLLGDMGADVIKIEEPGAGDDARGWGPFVGEWSAYFLGVNRNKRSLALDLKTDEGKDALRRLLATADVFIENFKPGSLEALGFGYDAVHALNPRLVYCSISGYGRTGPRRHLSGYDPVIQAESGFMDITGESSGNPMRTGIAMADYLAALYAFSGILLALRDRDLTGAGQQVDVALFDSVLSTLSMPAGILQATGDTPRRMGNDHPAIAPYEALHAKDGMVMIAAANPRLWSRLCDAVGLSHLADDPQFRTNADRVRNRPALKVELERAVSAYTVDELVAVMELAAVPCGRVRTVAEALRDPQVEARQMLLPLDGSRLEAFRVVGNPIKLSAHPQGNVRRPPRLGEHTEEVLAALGTAPTSPNAPGPPPEGGLPGAGTWPPLPVRGAS